MTPPRYLYKATFKRDQEVHVITFWSTLHPPERYKQALQERAVASLWETRTDVHTWTLAAVTIVRG